MYVRMKCLLQTERSVCHHIVQMSRSGRRVSGRGRGSVSSLSTAKELSELERFRQNEVVMKAKIRTVIMHVRILVYLSTLTSSQG